MEKNASSKLDSVFFPYYVNQARLLDIFAIINNGFAEYEVITEESFKSKNNAAKGSARAGFKLFKLGVDAEGEVRVSSEGRGSRSVRLVQTPSSMLGIVVSEMRWRGFLKDLLESVPGDFVLIPVNLKINSIKGYIGDLTKLTELGRKMQDLDKANSSKARSEETSLLKRINGVAFELFSAEEIISELDDYAVMGSISTDNLYEGVVQDIIDTDLMCLAQVKRVYRDGTRLMKNTMFSMIRDDNSKRALIDSLTPSDELPFRSYYDLKFEITGKPVYQLEIVALYQESNPRLPAD